jgi:hypothetical protein
MVLFCSDTSFLVSRRSRPGLQWLPRLLGLRCQVSSLRRPQFENWLSELLLSSVFITTIAGLPRAARSRIFLGAGGRGAIFVRMLPASPGLSGVGACPPRFACDGQAAPVCHGTSWTAVGELRDPPREVASLRRMR